MAQPDALLLLQQLLLRPEDYADFLQRPPWTPDAGRGADAPPPGPFDLPAPTGRGRFDQPSTPLNLRAVPTEAQLPLALLGGGYSIGRTSEPLNLQAGYNAPDLPWGFSGETSLRPGRGLGGVDLRAYLKMPF